MPESDHIMQLSSCTGIISSGKNEAPVAFTLECGVDGELTFNFSEILSIKRTGWLYDYLNQNQRYSKNVSLKARDSATALDISTDALICGLGIHSKGSKTVFNIDDAKCGMLQTIGKPRQKDGWYAWYQIQGLQGLRNIQMESALGLIDVSGSMDVKDHSLISGHITIKRTKRFNGNFDQWIKQCDEQARRILDIFSLAHGNYHRWTMGQYGNKRQTITRYYGKQKSDRRIFAVFHPLNPEPTLKLCLERYTEEISTQTGFSIAIKWLLEPQHYTDITYLSLFCALEHLIDRFADKHISPLLEKHQKKVVKKELERTIKTLDNSILTRDIRKHLIKNLEGVFRLSLNDKLDMLCKHYRVSWDGIHDAAKLINIRNRIVHGGCFSREEDESDHLYDYVAHLRELLVRILLGILDYEGKYFSYLDGQRHVTLPRASGV